MVSGDFDLLEEEPSADAVAAEEMGPLETVELADDEREELKELLSTYGFQLEEARYQKFRKIVPRSKRPFYGKETEEG